MDFKELEESGVANIACVIRKYVVSCPDKVEVKLEFIAPINEDYILYGLFDPAKCSPEMASLPDQYQEGVQAKLTRSAINPGELGVHHLLRPINVKIEWSDGVAWGTVSSPESIPGQDLTMYIHPSPKDESP
jgi:hypothetical protein